MYGKSAKNNTDRISYKGILTQQVYEVLQHEHGLVEKLLPITTTKNDMHSKILTRFVFSGFAF